MSNLFANNKMCSQQPYMNGGARPQQMRGWDPYYPPMGPAQIALAQVPNSRYPQHPPPRQDAVWYHGPPPQMQQLPPWVGNKSNWTNDPSKADSRLYFGRLPLSVSQEYLEGLCSAFGRVKAISSFSTYAFVQFARKEEAEKAREALHNRENKDGWVVNVRIAASGNVKPQTVNPSKAAFKQASQLAKQASGEPKSVRCPQCSRKFDSSWYLLLHLKEAHNTLVYMNCHE